MPEGRNPFGELKANESFIQFIEEQAIVFYDRDEAIRAAFKRMADAVVKSGSIKKSEVKSRINNSLEARAEQLIGEMEIIREHYATDCVQAKARRWSSHGGPETCIAGMLLNYALAGEKPALIALLKDTDDFSSKLLNKESIRITIKNLPEDILDGLRELRMPEIAERLRNKARQLQLELNDMRHWNGFLNNTLSDVAKSFHEAMSVEFPLPKPARSRKSSVRIRQQPPPKSLPPLHEHDMRMLLISKLPGMNQACIAEMINKEFKTDYKQPRVSEGIKRAKAFLEAGGLSETIALDNMRTSRPVSMDPNKLDRGSRKDGKASHMVEKLKQSAKDQEDNDK